MKDYLKHLTLIVLLVTIFPLQAQNKQVSLSAKNKPVKDVLSEIQQNSGYRILYNDEVVPDELRVTVNAENTAVKTILDAMLKNTGLTYIMQTDELIIITKKEYGQNSSDITGMVADENDDPLPFASVVLLSLPDSVFIAGVSTSANGGFSLSRQTDAPCLLQISYLGYEKAHRHVTQNTVGRIRLTPESKFLSEVSVIGNRPLFKLDNGALVTDVANSILSHETNMTDVLRKIPGIIIKDGKITSFTGGTPVIYINGRKAHSMNEVQQLEVKNIKDIKLNTNPGAEYDASAGAVLSITTLKRSDGWSLQVDAELRRRQKWGNSEALKFNYQKDGLNLFGTFGFDKYAKKSFQWMITEIATTDTLWQHSDRLVTHSSIPYFSYSAGADYAINKNHNIGFMYDGYTYSFDDSAPFNSTIKANDRYFAEIAGNSLLKDKDTQHHLNAYYSGKWSDKIKFDLYADYARTYTQRDQNIEEKSEYYGDTQTLNRNKGTYHVYAVSPKLSYIVASGHSLVAGGDWSRVEGDNTLMYEGKQGNNTQSQTEENKRAAYASYYFTKNNLTINAGLRFENVQYRYHDLLNSHNDIQKTYHDFFPSLSVSHTHKGLSQSINYGERIIRPQFGRLNNYSYYLNRFSQQEGNPKLQPQTAHKIQYSLMYRFIYLSLQYTYNKDFIGAYFYTNPQQPQIYINTWKNFDKQQQFSGELNLRHRFGIYEPSLTAMFQKNIQKVNSIEGDIIINKPIYFFQWNNDFRLPHKWLLNVEYFYRSEGSYQFFTFRAGHIFNMGVTKSFLDDALQVNLKGKDIFRKDIDIYHGRINNIYFWQHEDQDNRTFSLGITWRFNNYKKSYKGKSAAENEIQRL
ncbi:TonB-dependent receptor domain-containing protein [Limibacterium fermenti]|uniref:TonB-dependent receptor domain-containing protein n=1 Tax=Limibacterium fermenti TaxID=3229863 RepID=UPI003A7367CE